MIYLQLSAVFAAILAAMAWLKSAFLSLGLDGRPEQMKDIFNRISTNPAVWNAIAAALSALAAFCQAFAWVTGYEALHPITGG